VCASSNGGDWKGAVTIRLANAGDLDRVKACAEEAYVLYVPRMGKKPAPMIADFKAQIEAGQVYVIDARDEVAGFIVLYRRGDHLHVENVAVFPARQGEGLGRALLAFAEKEAARRNLPTIELYTNVKMTENLELYPRLGYVEIDRCEEAGFSRVFYRKEIGSH
jgi:ribosomal protein S18 acetylase RimI-like enzyme